MEIFKAIPRGLPGVRVFTYAGEPVISIQKDLDEARHTAGLEDFTFHDLRHTAINN
jgi:integrase